MFIDRNHHDNLQMLFLPPYIPDTHSDRGHARASYLGFERVPAILYDSNCNAFVVVCNSIIGRDGGSEESSR